LHKLKPPCKIKSYDPIR